MVTQIREMAEMMQRGWILEMEEKGKDTGFGKEQGGWWLVLESGANRGHAKRVHQRVFSECLLCQAPCWRCWKMAGFPGNDCVEFNKSIRHPSRDSRYPQNLSLPGSPIRHH